MAMAMMQMKLDKVRNDFIGEKDCFYRVESSFKEQARGS